MTGIIDRASTSQCCSSHHHQIESFTSFNYSFGSFWIVSRSQWGTTHREELERTGVDGLSIYFNLLIILTCHAEMILHSHAVGISYRIDVWVYDTWFRILMKCARGSRAMRGATRARARGRVIRARSSVCCSFDYRLQRYGLLMNSRSTIERELSPVLIKAVFFFLSTV